MMLVELTDVSYVGSTQPQATLIILKSGKFIRRAGTQM